MVLAEVVALPQQVQMELPALEQELAVTAAQELHQPFLAPQQLMPVVEVVALVMMALPLELVVLVVEAMVEKALQEQQAHLILEEEAAAVVLLAHQVEQIVPALLAAQAL
jgi:hypothetical protein